MSEKCIGHRTEFKMPCWKSRKLAKAVIWLAVPILLVSFATTIYFQTIYDYVLKTYITLGKGSLVTKIWEDIPLPIYEKLYFFNVTNKDAFVAGDEPLNVTQVGPYTYRSRWIKNHPQWNSNHTVSYREVRTYHFIPEMSNGTEDDIIYTLNGPMIIGANIVPPMMRGAFAFFCLINKERVLTRKSIRELAYQGYKDTIIKHAWILKPNVPYKDGSFSWLYGLNATDDGLFTVFTGTDDVRKTDLIDKWNGKEKLNFWTDDTCNMINGTSIETGPPIKGHQDSYTFFQTIFCRSITFDYTNDVDHYNILSKRFKPSYSLLANSSENSDNECFEVRGERASGVLDISSCQFGAPAFISFPHFYLADPSYLNPINGLDPNYEHHGSYIDVEPITGVSIDLTVRFQINLEIKPIDGFPQFDRITKGIYPVFWAELSLKIDKDLANFLTRNVKVPKIVAYGVLGALILISLLVVIISAVYLCVSKREDDDDPLIDAVINKLPFQGKNNDCNQSSEVVPRINANNSPESKKGSEMLCDEESSNSTENEPYDAAILDLESACPK